MRILALALILVAPTFASGDDIGSTMAALKDEKAQCRYLLQLCGEYAVAQRITISKNADAEAAVNRFKEARGANSAKREAQSAIAVAEAALSGQARELDKVTTARSVMKAMHEKMPPCVEECVDDKGKKILATW